MTAQEQLKAYFAAVAAVCFCVGVAAVLAAIGKLDGVIGGVIGAAVTGLFALANAPRRAGVNVETAEQVGPNSGASAGS